MPMPKRFSSPKTVSATLFKATCLEVMDEVAARGAEFIVTKHGKQSCAFALLKPHRLRRWALCAARLYITTTSCHRFMTRGTPR